MAIKKYKTAIIIFLITAGQVFGPVGGPVSAFALNRYWVGGTGNWSDDTNHWATASGGASGGGNLPGSGDTAIFDGSSGGGTCTLNQTVSITAFNISAGTTTVDTSGTDYALTTSGAFTVAAGTFTANGSTVTVSGNWSTNAGDFTEGTSSVVLNGTGNLDSTGDTFYNLTVGNGASSETTTITSDLTVSNVLTIVDSGDTLTDAAGGYNITVTGTGTPFVNNSSAVTANQFIYSNGTITIINAAGGTYNVTNRLSFENGNSSTTTYRLNGDVVVNGDLFISGTSILKAVWLDTSASNYNITSNNLTIGISSLEVGRLVSNAAIIDINGNVTLAAGSGSLAVDANTSSWTVSGNFTNTSAGYFSSGTSSITFDSSSSDQTVTTDGRSFYDFILNNTASSGSDDIIISGALDVNGTLTITDGDLDVSTNDPNVNIAGNMTVAAAGTMDTSAYTGTWTFDGSGTDTLTDNTASGLDYKSVTVNGTTKVLQLASSGSPTFKFSTLTIGADDTIDLNGQNTSITTLDNSGTFQLEGGETVAITTMDTNSGTVLYDGAGTYTGLAAGNNYYNLSFNNAATGNWTLNAALDANNDLTLTDGVLDTNTVSDYAVNVTNDLTMTGGTFVGNSSMITVSGNLALNGTEDSTQLDNSSVILDGTGSLSYSSLVSTSASGVNNLTVGQSGNITTTSSSFAIYGMLTIGSGTYTGTEVHYLRGDPDPLSFDSNSTVSIKQLRFFGSNQNIPTLVNGYDSDIRVSRGANVLTQTGTVTINGTNDLILDGDAFASREVTYDTAGFDLVVGGNITIGSTNNDTALKTLNGTNNSITVGGNFDIKSVGSGSAQATFTSTGSTVTLSGTADQAVNMYGSSFNDLTLNNTGASGSDDIIILGDLDIDGTLTITDGDLDISINDPVVNTAGNVSIAANGSIDVSSRTANWTFDGTSTLTDSSSTGPQDLEDVVLNGTSLTLGSDAKVQTMTVTSGILNLGSSNYTLEIDGTGTPLSNSGTFTAGTSTVKYTGTTTATDVTTVPYSSLQFAPTGATTYSLTENLTGGNAMTGDLTIDTNATLDSTAANNYNLSTRDVLINGTFTPQGSTVTVSGDWEHTNGTFTMGTSTIDFTGTGTIKNDVASWWAQAFYSINAAAGGQITTIFAGRGINVKNICTLGTGTLTGGALDFGLGSGTPLVTGGATIGSLIKYDGNTGPVNVAATDYASLWFAGNSATNTFNLAGNITCTSLQVNGNGTNDLAVLDTTTNNYSITASSTLRIGSGSDTAKYGTLKLNNSSIDLNGNVFIYASDGSGTNSIDADTSTITAAGSWTNSDTFTADTSTVNFDGAALQTVTACSSCTSGNFNVLEVSNASANGVSFADAFTAVDFTDITAGSKLTLKAGSTYTISGTLTLTGSISNEITLLSDSGGTRFTFDVTGGDQGVNYVNVTDSEVSSNNISARSSTSASNNDEGEVSPHWLFSTRGAMMLVE